MKALSLTQPYASLVAVGAKLIETRSWSTKYRGPLAIHAAKGLGPVGGRRGLRELCREPAFTNALYDPDDRPHQRIDTKLPLGAFVAVAVLADVAVVDTTRPGPWWTAEADEYPERLFGDYAEGRFMWRLTNVQALKEPIPCRGALGLWPVPPHHCCLICGKLMRPSDLLPFDDDSDCGGDCRGCVRGIEAEMEASLP